MAVIGKNILENLTTGMYSDSKVIYREYIQNACDSIDVANRIGLFTDQHGEIEIEIDTKKFKYLEKKFNEEKFTNIFSQIQ